MSQGDTPRDEKPGIRSAGHRNEESRNPPRITERHRPEIDGLRAIAILGVVLNHAGFGLPGGYVGVDVFFVISGYLITSLILTRVQAGTFTLTDFWERRVRRIAPAFLAMQLGVVAAGWWLFLPHDYARLAKASAAQSLFLGNVYSWRDTGYFSVNAALRPMLHTWSLAVEEQFYLVFPLTLVWVCRRAPRSLRWLTVLACVASLIVSVVGTYRSPSASYYLLPTRAWELLAGAILAFYRERAPSRALGEALSWVGLGLIGLAMGSYSENTAFPGYAAAVPVVGSALVIFGSNSQPSAAGKILGSPLFVAIGKLSYPLYLWHWPLLAFTRYCKDGPLDWALRASLVGIAFVCAAISVAVVEGPIRQRRWLASGRSIFTFCGAAAGVMLLASAVIFLNDGLASRLPVGLRQPAPDLSKLVINVAEAAEGRFPRIGDQAVGKNPSFIVWGDSQSVADATVFDELGAEYRVAGLIAGVAGGVPLPGIRVRHDPTLPERNRIVADEIAKRKIKHVFLIARWSWYVQGQSPYDISARGGVPNPLIYEKGESQITSDEAIRLFRRAMHQLCSNLADQGCHTYLVMQTPDQPMDPYRRAFLRARGAGGLTTNAFTTLDDYEQRTARVKAVFEDIQGSLPGVHVVDGIQTLLGPENVIRWEQDDRLLYFDDHHFTPWGARVALRNILEPMFQEIHDQQSAALE